MSKRQRNGIQVQVEEDLFQVRILEEWSLPEIDWKLPDTLWELPEDIWDLPEIDWELPEGLWDLPEIDWENPDWDPIPWEEM